MATLTVDRDVLRVSFTTAEKVGGLLRDQEVPLRDVTGVDVVRDGLAAARGLRAPGLGLPGVRKIGHYRRPGHSVLVSVRRGQQALRIGVGDHRFDELLIGADDAAALRDLLRSATDRAGHPDA